MIYKNTLGFICNLNRIIFVLVCVLTILIVNIVIVSLPFSENMNNVAELIGLKESGVVIAFFSLVIAAPLFETFIFQHFPLRLVSILFKKQKNINMYAIIVSATIFGFAHNYNTTYVVIAFIVGAIFASIYLISFKRNESPIVNVFWVHLLLNIIPFLRDFVFDFNP